MSIFGEDRPSQYAGNALIAKSVREPTIKERISMNVQRCEEQLADAKRVQEILDRNPDLEELLNIMQKNSF